tara:strand:+ start:171 stop:590 length:420 start_codon:yes stop_codon:yes gene_type:complete
MPVTNTFSFIGDSHRILAVDLLLPVYGQWISLFSSLLPTQEHHMAVGIVATLKIQADKIEAFETDFKALMAIVAEQEPGNNYYDLHRSRDDAGSYVVMEQYVDQAALDLHGKSDEFKAKSAKLGDYLAGAPTVTILDAV